MKPLRYLLLYSLITTLLHASDCHEDAREYVLKAEQCKTDNNIEQALVYYKKAIALNPNDVMLIFNTANELYNNGFKEEALTYYDQALAVRSDIEQIYFNKGIVHTQLEQHGKAADCFLQAIRTNKNYTKAYTHAGNALNKANRHEEAIEIYKRGIEIDYNNADLHYRLALIYRHKDLFHEAIQELRNAIAKNPQSSVYKLELANTLHLVDGSQEAVALYTELLEKHPDNYNILYNLGYTIKKLGYIEKALEIYNKVLEINPEYALARFSRALAYLILGNWKQGWQEYEWRWKSYGDSPKKFNRPVWDGSTIQGKRILLYAEQGLGDTIQFIRYALLVKDLGAYVIVETQSALKDLLKLCPYIDEVYARGEKIPPFDVQIPLMSLPFIFKTEVDTVPDTIPYIYAKPELVDYWAEQLKNDHNFKIGICWQGNPNYSTQFLRQAVAGKSMHVKHFEPIARLKGVTLYNLQKMGGEEQLKELSSDINIVTFNNDFDVRNGRFMDTLAVLSNLDLVITIDTGTCHVAAALGVPTWNLLPNPADWRWMIDCTDTPWYNNMRLFKQSIPGDWQGVIAECVKALQPILRGEKTVEEVTQEKGKVKELRPYEAIVSTKNSAQLPEKTTPLATTIHTLNKELFTFEPLEEKSNKQVPCIPIQTTTKSNNSITAQLIAINQQLTQYEQQLKGMHISVFDDTFITFIQKILTLHQEKKELKTKINTTKLDKENNAPYNI